jgi:hypothetical protein
MAAKNIIFIIIHPYYNGCKAILTNMPRIIVSLFLQMHTPSSTNKIGSIIHALGLNEINPTSQKLSPKMRIDPPNN